jgi:hypothetical protein
MESKEVLPVDSWIALAELLVEAVVLLELVWESLDWAGLDEHVDPGSLPEAWKVSLSNGRFLGEALRTTVGSRGRNMAFDILCMKAGLVPCSLEIGLGCSTTVGCSEARETHTRSARAWELAWRADSQLLVSDLRAEITLTPCRRSLADSAELDLEGAIEHWLETGSGVFSGPGEESPV